MRKLIVAMLATALAAGALIFVGYLLASSSDPWAAFRAAVLNLAFALVILGPALYLVGLAGAHLVRLFRERRPDAAGRLPVPTHQLDILAPAALAAYHRTQYAAAERPIVPTVPHSLSYNAGNQRVDSAGIVSAATPEAAPPAPAVVPSFSDLLSQRRIGRGHPLLLGFERDTGAELPGSWLDLYATATAGLPGSGKTTSQRFFAAQTALHGARFVVCDPHAGAADDSLAATLDPLRAVYLCEPADDPKRILEAVRYVAHIGEERVKGRDTSTTPIILWVDELTGLTGRSDVGDTLAELLEKIAQEYRKRYVYLSASGQIWTAARTSSELRDSLASVLCHRMKRSQARMLLPTDEAAQVERLATGEAVLWRTNGTTVTIKIPNTTSADVRRVAELLAADAPAQAHAAGDHQATGDRVIRLPASAWRKPDGSQMVAGAEQATTASGRAESPSAEAQRAAALFLAGSDLASVVYELRGVKSNEGRRYQVAAAEVQALIRSALTMQALA